MKRVIQNANKKGSLKNIQVLINKNQDLIDARIKSRFKDLIEQQIIWISPVERDDFAEYWDNKFLKKIGLDPKEIKLENFWPKNGAHWDALAKTNVEHIILIEAKANIPEIISNASIAKRAASKALINKSLNQTKAFLNITNKVDWAGPFYQYTNRLAHLYYLRNKCEKSVFLVNIYFIGDVSVSGPETKEEWVGALKVMKKYLGLTRHKLSRYMTDIFINVQDLTF